MCEGSLMCRDLVLKEVDSVDFEGSLVCVKEV